MGKKNVGIIQHLYLVGMAICAIGFLCPLFKALGQTANGFDLISKDSSVISAGILLIFIGAVAGAVLCFVKIKNAKLFKLIALAASILGGIILVVQMNNSALSRLIGKEFLKHATFGFYMIIAGWIIAIAGFIKTK